MNPTELREQKEKEDNPSAISRVVSWIEDGFGNLIERIEGGEDRNPQILVHPVPGVDPLEVEKWYWHAVGVRV